MKTRAFEILVTKLQLQTRDTGDRHAFFIYEGRVITRTKRSHGRGEMPDYWIRQQLKVNEVQLSDLIGCTLKREDYVAILKEKGLI
jgi:hypothetical protein